MLTNEEKTKKKSRKGKANIRNYMLIILFIFVAILEMRGPNGGPQNCCYSREFNICLLYCNDDIPLKDHYHHECLVVISYSQKNISMTSSAASRESADHNREEDTRELRHRILTHYIDQQLH